MITATRYHDLSCGHRVVGHEGKCAHLHGHNYRVHFTVSAEVAGLAAVDDIGRVVDFSVINTHLCQWLEKHWDHKFLVWAKDPWRARLRALDPAGVVIVSFNPTAENIGRYLIQEVAPKQLRSTRVELISVLVEETRKCSAAVSLEFPGGRTR